MKKTAIIMAGGSGERFWPLSRKTKPKQLLKITSNLTMLEESIERIAPLIPMEDVYIITSEILLEPIRATLLNFPPENVIAEPFKRNTAPCLALGAAFILQKYSNDYKPDEISIAILTADQMINPVTGFVKTVESAMRLIEQEPVLATIGITPNRPETGYGYVEVAEPFEINSVNPEIKKVIKFHEKPSLEKAEKYVESGKYLWNSGMFFWRLDTFIDNMCRELPSVGTQIQNMAELLKGRTNIPYNTSLNFISDIYEKFPDISIDYGLMEKAKNVVVAKALFDWDDIGSWDSLTRFKESDEDGNIFEGHVSHVDIYNTSIINKSNNRNIIVAGIGLDNMVIVVTDDAILVCPKDRVQEVKKNVEHIRKLGLDKWL